MAFGPTSLWPIEGEKVETVTDFIFIAIGPGSVSGLGTKILVCLKKKNKQTNKNPYSYLWPLKKPRNNDCLSSDMNR